jgi:hypothetical protein
LGTINTLALIHRATGLELLQMFVLGHDTPRMSPSVAKEMELVRRAPDHVSYAWWLGHPTTRFREFDSNLIYATSDHRERVWLKRTGYHAALPVRSVMPFVTALTDPGDLVLDPFAGLNATGQAARQLGRRWRSVDVDPEMAWKAMSRPFPDVA